MDNQARLIIPARLDPSSFARIDRETMIWSLAGHTMGTVWSVKLVARLLPRGLERAIQAVVDEVVAEMSGWEADSALSRFNRAGDGTWHGLPSDFFHVLRAGIEIARHTRGAFDPTIGTLVDLWGFGPATARMAPPSEQEIAAALGRSGWQRMQLDHHARRALQPGVALDLSGIAKGYAVDRVAALLVENGVANCLVEVGGELKGLGVRRDGQPWWVSVEAPPGTALPETRIALHGLAVATSGDYRRFFDHDGKRYAHSIDPRTGSAVENELAAVTVLHTECLAADAYATALLVLGETDGPAFAAAHHLAALFVTRDGREILSPDFAAMADE